MPEALRIAKRILLSTYLVAIHLALFYFIGERVVARYTAVQPVVQESVSDPTARAEIPTPLPVPETFADRVDTNSNVSAPAQASSSALLVPVAGVKPEQLTDNFSDVRSEGRSHDAIDIPAPAGTPVVAATDGEIVKFWDSERGGITIYQLTSDRKFVLYYAHLQRRADGINIGSRVAKGATIGYVGDTGNAGAGNFHLHFSIARVTDPNRVWEGENLNPYPHLKFAQPLTP